MSAEPETARRWDREVMMRGRHLVLVLVVLVAVAGMAVWARRASAGAPATIAPAGAVPADVPASAASLQDAYIGVIQRVRPSVVEVATSAGLGSGVVYDDQGHIVTNAHVVGNASRFHVTLVDGRSFDATLVGTYPADDLAVIKLSSGTPPAPARFGDSSQVKAGEFSLAIGNPLGLASSVTDGIVSFTGRTVSEGDGVVLPSTIQTSAAVNPGNSGGALVDLGGEVIGIPTLAASDPQMGGAAGGIGFAIPSNTVKRIADQLIQHGKVTNSGRGALGLSATTATTLSGRPVGVLIRQVDPHGAAEAAGLQPGDIITAVDGQATTDLAALQELLAQRQPGANVRLNVLHSDATAGSVEVDVTLGSL